RFICAYSVLGLRECCSQRNRTHVKWWFAAGKIEAPKGRGGGRLRGFWEDAIKKDGTTQISHIFFVFCHMGGPSFCPITLSPAIDANIQCFARVIEAAFKIDALLLLQRFVHHGGMFAGDVLDHHRAHERMSALGERDKAREFRRWCLWERFPETG